MISRRGPRNSEILSANDEKNAAGDPDGVRQAPGRDARRVQYRLYVICAVARRLDDALPEGKNLPMTDSFMRDRRRGSAQCGKIQSKHAAEYQMFPSPPYATKTQAPANCGLCRRHDDRHVPWART